MSALPASTDLHTAARKLVKELHDKNNDTVHLRAYAQGIHTQSPGDTNVFAPGEKEVT